MTISPKQFEQFLTKLAQDSAPDDNENATLRGQQAGDVPQMLQPEEGPGAGSRDEIESLSTGAESAHKQNREGGYLPNAFDTFNSAAKETGKDLKGLLTSYGPKAVVGGATPEAGATKISSVQIEAFSDELSKIKARL